MHTRELQVTSGRRAICRGPATIGSARSRLWPLAVRYAHQHGSPGHGRDHLLPAFVSPSVVLPVVDGAPALGTWQSVVLVDSNVDNPRRTVRLSFISG